MQGAGRSARMSVRTLPHSARPHSEWTGPRGRSRARDEVCIEDFVAPLWQHELRELFRGFAGALFVALPLLYTQEMWERSREIAPSVLIIILLVALVINMGYIAYSGYKVSRTRTALLWDSITAVGLGAVASLVTLVITARIRDEVPFEIAVCLVALMSVPTSFGAALAINQLGKRDKSSSKSDDSSPSDSLSEDWQKITSTILGATLFSFNVMPTVEPKVMLMELSSWHALGILVFSLLLSYGIEFTSRFHSEDTDESQGVLREAWLVTVVAYLVALLMSAMLLWMFGYINTGTPPEMWVPWLVVVGYAATLGGTAGRLVL